MKGFVLVLMLTLVGCQHLNKQPVFSQNKCYTYKYELKQVTRIPAEWYSGVGIKLLSKVEICDSRSGLYLIRIYSPEGYEYKTNSPRPEFIRSPELTNSFAAKFVKQAAFRLENGRIRNIMAPANHSTDGLNIYKGFVKNFNFLVKDMREYTLQEDGIEGLCNATYTILDSKKTNQMLMMKTKDLNGCLNRVEKIVGAAYAIPCTECKENSQAAVTSTYYIKPTKEGPVIDEVDVTETHQYMPFNGINGGSIVMEASQNIKLIKVEQHQPEELPANFKDCGSLAFQFSDESQQLSTPVKQLERQIVDDLQYLAQHTWETISRDWTQKFQRLTQNMHKADYELYDSVYKKCSSELACRRIFWDVVASADNPNAIRLLKLKYEQKEVTNFEAAQIVIISFHYSSPSLQVIEEAKTLLRVVHQHPHGYLFRIVFLAYASLCHKYCIALNTCPESALKPVNDFANEVLSRPNEDDIILLLRLYENLQHRSVMKPFTKFLPGFATSDFSLRVQHVALLCLKSFAKKDATWVRRTSMQIFLNYKLHYSTRIFAVMSLLSAKPGLPTLMILAKSLANEPSTYVEHFVISSLTTLATSTSPDLQVVASASRMALNIVTSKSEWPKYATARFFLLSFYKESLMAGVTTEIFILNNAGSIFPNFMSTRFETNIFGNKFSPLEVGIGIPHLSEFLLKRRQEADNYSDRSVNARKLLKMHSDQKVSPREEPIVGGYVQMFGQNIITATADMKTVVKACQEFYRPERSDSWIMNLIYKLQKGVPMQWVKALTSVDASYAVAVGTGLPLERSLTHVAVTSFAGNAKAWFTPELPQNRDLSKLNITDIRLKTEMSFSIDKRMIFRMGIRNSLLQAGLEEYAKLTVNLPIKAADVTMNIKNKSFKLEIPPCKEETDIFSLSARTYAVVHNGEEASAAKLTPVRPPQTVSNIMNWDFKSDSASHSKRKERPYSKTSSAESTHHTAPLPWCLDANKFGSKTCIKYSAVHAEPNVILNRFVGDHNITCTMYPVRSEPPIKTIQVIVQRSDAHRLGDPKTDAHRFGDRKTDVLIEKSKIRVQHIAQKETSSSSEDSSVDSSSSQESSTSISAGIRVSSSESSSASSSESSSESSTSKEADFLEDRVSPSLTFVAQAIKSNNEKQGYKATIYVTDDESNKLEMQMVMVDLNDIKQMACLNMDVWPYKAQASLRTNNRCQYKSLDIEVSKGHIASNPAIQVKMKSKKLPYFLKKPALMAEELLPSLASLFDFNSVCQNNTSKEIVVGVAPSSQSVFVICKLPEKTLYKEGLNVPWTSVVLIPQYYPSDELTAFNFHIELTSRMLKEDEAVCQVEETGIRTFDDMRFNGSFNENCRILIAQECTEKPQFSIITRKPKLDLPREVYIHLTSVNITISPALNSPLLVSFNGEPMDKDMYEDSKEDITISRNESVVFIKAPQHGLENVTYDSETLWVTVSSRMRGKTCGLCGNNDGEKRNEGHMPNQELAYNDMTLFHSWLLEDSDCVTGLYPGVGDVAQPTQMSSIME